MQAGPSLDIVRKTNNLPKVKSQSLRAIAVVFLAALALYIALYKLIEHQRIRKGPWQISFTNGADGLGLIFINQPALHISNFPIRLLASIPTNTPPQILSPREPRRVPFQLPAGQCVFMDTTILPGTVVMQLGGHEVQLMPRVLVVDGREFPWSSGSLNLATMTNQ